MLWETIENMQKSNLMIWKIEHLSGVQYCTFS